MLLRLFRFRLRQVEPGRDIREVVELEPLEPLESEDDGELFSGNPELRFSSTQSLSAWKERSCWSKLCRKCWQDCAQTMGTCLNTPGHGPPGSVCTPVVSEHHTAPQPAAGTPAH